MKIKTTLGVVCRPLPSPPRTPSLITLCSLRNVLVDIREPGLSTARLGVAYLYTLFIKATIRSTSESMEEHNDVETKTTKKNQKKIQGRSSFPHDLPLASIMHTEERRMKYG